jgi:putative transposase
LPGLRPFRAETRRWRVSGTPFTPIESVFATVRHRTVRTKGALSQKTAKLMVFTLVRTASKKWRRLKGANQLPRVIEGVSFTDGVVSTDDARNRAA